MLLLNIITKDEWGRSRLSKKYGIYSIDLIVPLGKPSFRFNAWLLKDDKTVGKHFQKKIFVVETQQNRMLMQ